MTDHAKELIAADQHWAVSVYRAGENIVTIESNCLSGREIKRSVPPRGIY